MTEPRAPDAAADAAPLPARRRILGIDVARALAIVGMLAVHVGPTDAGGLAGRVYALPHGRASLLFVLVAGIGVSLMVAGRGARSGATRTLAWRALLLLPIGLALQELDHRVFVILQTYAVLFLAAIAAIRLPDRTLLLAACLTAIAGPAVYLAGLTLDPGTFDRTAVHLSDAPGVIAHRLLLSGPYPLVVWAAPFLFGMWIGRRDLRARGVRLALATAGGAVAGLATAVGGVVRPLAAGEGATGWARLLDVTPHSQMALWLVGSTGAAVLVLGLSLLAADAWRRAAWPLAALGQLALSVYVAHLLALHAWSAPLRSDEVGRAAVTVAAFTVAAATLAVAWRARFARGPLEALLAPPGARAPRPRAP